MEKFENSEKARLELTKTKFHFFFGRNKIRAYITACELFVGRRGGKDVKS